MHMYWRQPAAVAVAFVDSSASVKTWNVQRTVECLIFLVAAFMAGRCASMRGVLAGGYLVRPAVT